MIDLPLESLFVLKIGAGNPCCLASAGPYGEDQFAVVVDEKGCLVGKINRQAVGRGIQAGQVRSMVEPLKGTVLDDDNALDLVDRINGQTNEKRGRIYVIDRQNRLLGAVSPGNKALHMLLGMREFVPFPNIFDAMYEAVVIIDSGSTIIYVNHAYSNIVGVPGGKIIGRKMEEVEPTSMCLKVLRGHPPVINEKIAIQSIGVEVLANITPFYVNGELKGVISVFRNIYETINLSNELQKMRDIAQYLQNELKCKSNLPEPFTKMVGSNVYFRQALVLAATAAPTDATVMIRGESGSGKEILAEAIQKSSSRKEYPFVKVNCASIPESLLESELFGYEEGAFTGAKKGGKPGKFELAHRGTIFLDEVGDMSPAMQSKLLRVLQEKEIERVGGSKAVQADVRVISATNKDLETMVINGSFREDLYYRLNVIPVFLPPLRSRKDDIPQLVDYFLKLYCREHGKNRTIVSSGVMNTLIGHEWPGNVRELKNVIEHAVVLCSGDMVTPENLPRYLRRNQGFNPREWRQETLPQLVEELEKEVISRVIKKCGNKSTAIKALGISRRTFYLKLKKYRIMV